MSLIGITSHRLFKTWPSSCRVCGSRCTPSSMHPYSSHICSISNSDIASCNIYTGFELENLKPHHASSIVTFILPFHHKTRAVGSHRINEFIVCQRRCSLGTILRPTDWGWKMVYGHLVPVLTDQPAAPDILLHVIHCGCTGNCSTTHCTCKVDFLIFHGPIHVFLHCKG